MGRQTDSWLHRVQKAARVGQDSPKDRSPNTNHFMKPGKETKEDLICLQATTLLVRGWVANIAIMCERRWSDVFSG